MVRTRATWQRGAADGGRCDTEDAATAAGQTPGYTDTRRLRHASVAERHTPAAWYSLAVSAREHQSGSRRVLRKRLAGYFAAASLFFFFSVLLVDCAPLTSTRQRLHIDPQSLCNTNRKSYIYIYIYIYCQSSGATDVLVR